MPDATVTFNFADAIGSAYDPARTKFWLEFNTAEGWVIDADGKVRAGAGVATVDAAGLVTVAGIPIPSASTNPTSFQVKINYDAPPRAAQQRNVKRERGSFGWFTVTASAALDDLVEEQFVPPTYLSTVTAQLDTYVDAAEGHADDAAASAAAAGTSAQDAETSKNQAAAIALGDAEAAFDGFLAARDLPEDGAALSASIEATASALDPTLRDFVEAQVLAGVAPRPRMETQPTFALGKASGISNVTIATGGSGYVVGDEITLAGGTLLVTGVGASVLRVSAVSAGAITGVTIVTRGAYTTVPTNAVAQGSTTGVGAGATFTVNWTGSEASTMRNNVYVAPNAATMRFTGNGPTNLSSSGYYGNSVGNGTHSTFEWATDSTHVNIRFIGLNTNAVLFIDGVQVRLAPFTTDASGNAYLLALLFGGTKRSRNFKLVAANQAFGGIRVDSDATTTAPTTRTKPLLWWLGDSYVFGTGAENVATQAAMVAGQMLDVDVLPDGIGGTGWGTIGGNLASTRVTAKLGALTRLAEVTDVVLDMGYNDAGGNMTTVATNFDDAVAAVQSTAPTARIHVFGPATPLGETANLATVKDTISARCTALGLRFYDIADVVDAENESIYTGADNVHANGLGHKYLGAVKAALLKPHLAGVAA